MGGIWGDLAGRSCSDKKNHERSIFHCKNQSFSQNFPGSVDFARRFEGRCHQVPIFTIEKASRQRDGSGGPDKAP